MILGYMRILILLATVPGIFLMWKIYNLDTIEKEPPGLLVKLFFSGALTIISALILETLGDYILGYFFYEANFFYCFLENFIVVACSEEFGKFFVLKKISWNDYNFNFQFDAVIYAVAVGVGFAVFENISYAFSFGIGTTLIRAVTAIPAHVIFAIFMGHYFGRAKYYERMGMESHKKYELAKAYIVPVFLHGLYDFIASDGSEAATILFVVFVVILDVIAYKKVKKYAREDQEV